MTKIRAKIHDYSNQFDDDNHIIVTEEQYKVLEWFIEEYCGDLGITRESEIEYLDLTEKK